MARTWPERAPATAWPSAQLAAFCRLAFSASRGRRCAANPPLLRRTAFAAGRLPRGVEEPGGGGLQHAEIAGSGHHRESRVAPVLGLLRGSNGNPRDDAVLAAALQHRLDEPDVESGLAGCLEPAR